MSEPKESPSARAHLLIECEPHGHITGEDEATFGVGDVIYLTGLKPDGSIFGYYYVMSIRAMAEPATPPALVYLASPYSHPDPAVREQRFSAACRMTTRLIESGEMVFSPIVHSHPLVEHGAETDWQAWQHYDRAMIDYCGEVRVLMIAGWVDSVGVQAEIAYAKEHGKRVTYTCMEALPAQLEDAAPPQGD